MAKLSGKFLGEDGLKGVREAFSSWLGKKQDKISFPGTTTTYLNGSGQFSTPPNTDTNVSQNHTTGSAEYPVLLKNGTGTGNTTSSALFDGDVTVNPSNGNMTMPTIRPLRGHYIHTASGTSGTAGVVAVAKMVITANYTNTPIHFRLFRRGSQTACDVYVMFSNTNSNDPALSSIKFFGTDYGVAIHKSATSTWDLYVTKSEAYDNIQVEDFYSTYVTNGSGITLTWTNVHASAIPSDAVKASNMFGNATTGANGLMSSTDKAKLDGIAEGANSIRYATCATAAATAAKDVTISDGKAFSLGSGAFILVKFTNGNTASSMTFKVNGSAASAVQGLATPLIPAGTSVLFYFTA